MSSNSKLHGLTPAQIRKAIYGEKKANYTPVAIVSKSKKPEKAVREVQNQDVGMLLNLPFSSTSAASEYRAPEWFASSQKSDVSVIVPLYNNSAANMIRSWDKTNGGMRVEVIFVEDNCPVNSKQQALNECEQNKTIKGRVYASSIQQGWAACCNIGAERATGDVLVFVHPDTTLSEGWLRPMVRLLRKPDVGVVGALNVDQDGRTYANAGYEWHWEEDRFLPIGRETYNGQKISRAFTIDNTPADLLESTDVEKINGQCMAIRRKDFLSQGGFNHNLVSCEWCDADLCMTMKEKGYRIISQCASKVIKDPTIKKDRSHEQGKVHFNNKWVVSGRLDQLVKNKRKQNSDVKNIVIRRRAAHGDVLMASSVASALKKKYPKAQVIFSTDCPEVLENHPHIDKVVEIHSERWFDLYFDLDMVYEYRPFTNILESYADACGVSLEDCDIKLHTVPLDVQLPDNYVVLHAGQTMWAGRNWSTLKFDQISNRLRSSGFQIVIVGTGSDHKTPSCDLDLRDKTTVAELAWVIKNAKMFVGIDSFPMHVAQSMSVPGVCFFGSILPETRLLKNSSIKSVVAEGIKCLGCHHRKSTPCTATTSCEIGIQDCVNNVTVDHMWRAIEKLAIHKDK